MNGIILNDNFHFLHLQFASFQYTDKILEGWKKKQVTSLEDVRTLDAEHKKRRQDKKPQKQTPASNNRFNNF